MIDALISYFADKTNERLSKISADDYAEGKLFIFIYCHV